MPNSQGFVVSQSAWAMDAVEDFETSTIYTAGSANSGSAGELQNDYTIVHGNNRYPNAYALSCSNLGITWAAVDAAPEFANGTGVQIGYSGSINTSSLPAGSYKLGSEWATQLAPASGFTLSAWISPISASFTDTSELGPNSNMFIQDWPIFYFGRRDETIVSPGITHPGNIPCSGSIYLGLVKEGIGGSVLPGFEGMNGIFKIAAYVNYRKRSVLPSSINFFADKAYSNTNYTAYENLLSSASMHVVMVYDPYPSGFITETRVATERLKIYVNGSQIDLTFDNPYGTDPIPTFDPTPLSPIIPAIVGNSSFIGNAKRVSKPLFLTGYPGSPLATGSTFHIFNGTIDEPSVYSRPLTSVEVTELYNSGRVTDLNNLSFSGDLISWWRCGDTSGDTEGTLATGFIKDIGPFGADAGNITEMILGVDVSASIAPDSGSVVFSTTGTVPGSLLGLRASPIYNRKQTLQSVYSVVDQHGVEIPERSDAIDALTLRWTALSDCSSPYLDEAPLGSIQPYGGTALWEADRLAGSGNPFVSSPRSPFYDSYEDYAVDTKYIFKEGTIIPEFRISNQIENYAKNNDFLIKRCDNFSIFGIPTGNVDAPQNSSETNFSTYYTNSEFMQFFDVVKTDHDGVAIPSEIAIKCKGLKKFIPYDGFYPAERTLQIVSQFSKSYSEFIEAVGGTDTDVADAVNRPVMAAMFSPGILYNSIKAGMAVDYPVALDTISKFEYTSFVSGATELTSSGYWALGTGSNGTNGWDYRVPFEALLEPEEYLQDKNLVDMEPDPSCSLDLTAKIGQSGDNLYKLMINNFLAEVPEFFLQNNEFTAIRSIPDNSKDFGKVEAGKTYGMRVKMRRSMNKTRRWFHPSFPAEQSTGFETITGYELPQDPLYQPSLKETFTMYSRPSAFGPPVAAVGTLFNPITGSKGGSGGLEDNGRQSWAGGASSRVVYSCSLGQQNRDLYPSDSLNGYNPSFTPPYYNGEAWADILYTAPASVTGNVSLDDILNNSKIIYWRIDGRPILRTSFKGSPSLTTPDAFYGEWDTPASASLPFRQFPKPAIWAPSTSSTLLAPFTGLSSYDPGDSGTGWHFWGVSSTWNGSGSFPMAPLHANKFAMQLSASVNLLGREDVLVQDFSADGKRSQESTVNLSGRWVIQPKFETPMFNFGDQSIRPISSASNTLTIPTNGSESVPRGMWHQFGCLPRPNEGIYLEVSDIPADWVTFRGAYTGSEKVIVITDVNGNVQQTHRGDYTSEHYDDYGAGSGVSSLMDVAGFTQTVDEGLKVSAGRSRSVIAKGQRKISKKLGQLKEGKSVAEAIVAIPFYLKNGNQKLFKIDKGKIQAILDQQAGILSISEDAEIGQSLFDLVAKMQKFVLPPRYDFVNYPEVLNDSEIGAFAMYIFEFEHTFSSEDLSYIWQNVQPNAGLKSVFDDPDVEATISHPLVQGELLDAEDFEQEIRWVVFKVKQRASKNYFDKTTANKRGKSSINFAVSDPTAPSYNWPYDFFSLIELGNMETEVTLKKEGGIEEKQTELLAANPEFKFPTFNYNEKE